MKPYGLRNKLLYNYTDNHPRKGWVNWWEVEIGTVKSKKRDRLNAKKLLRKYLK
jgi:hypothetical protein